jgi:hypothetical protein
MIELPSVRSDAAPVRGLGHPIETVLRRGWRRPIMLGAANTRVRDYADIYMVTGRHDLMHDAVHAALDVTARFRGVEIAPLSSVVDDLAEWRARIYTAFRTALGVDGAVLPRRRRRGRRGGDHVRRPAGRPSQQSALARGRAPMDRGDVASNVAIGNRSDVTGQRATPPDTRAHRGRLMSCPRGFVAVRRSDTIGRGWPSRDAAGRVGRFVVCMAWKRSGVRFPLAPLQNRRSEARYGSSGALSAFANVAN